MVIIGLDKGGALYFLVRPFPKQLPIRHLVILIGLKLMVIPLLFWGYFHYFSSNAMMPISVLEAGMPIAITPFILAELYPMERELIAFGVVISSVLSMLTLSGLMILVGVV